MAQVRLSKSGKSERSDNIGGSRRLLHSLLVAAAVTQLIRILEASTPTTVVQVACGEHSLGDQHMLASVCPLVRAAVANKPFRCMVVTPETRGAGCHEFCISPGHMARCHIAGVYRLLETARTDCSQSRK